MRVVSNSFIGRGGSIVSCPEGVLIQNVSVTLMAMMLSNLCTDEAFDIEIFHLIGKQSAHSRIALGRRRLS